MTILSPTNLETDTYDQPGWVYLYNKNIDLLNRVLLKIQGLVDVDVSQLPDNGVLTWDASASKWKVKYYG